MWRVAEDPSPAFSAPSRAGSPPVCGATVLAPSASGTSDGLGEEERAVCGPHGTRPPAAVLVTKGGQPPPSPSALSLEPGETARADDNLLPMSERLAGLIKGFRKGQTICITPSGMAGVGAPPAGVAPLSPGRAIGKRKVGKRPGKGLGARVSVGGRKPSKRAETSRITEVVLVREEKPSRRSLARAAFESLREAQAAHGLALGAPAEQAETAATPLGREVCGALVERALAEA